MLPTSCARSVDVATKHRAWMGQISRFQRLQLHHVSCLVHKAQLQSGQFQLGALMDQTLVGIAELASPGRIRRIARSSRVTNDLI
jgi:hypothetical protein